MRRVLCLLSTVALLAGCGQTTTSSAEEFEGEERAVAQVVEDLQEAGESNDPAAICGDILEQRFADQLKQAGTTCEAEMRRSIEDADDFELRVEDVTVTGNSARATVRRREGDGDQRAIFEFVKVAGKWRASKLSG